ncbi:MAG: polyprenyl diphosphate synthase [Brachymonas sp.]|nr:polyprenyl diphosphate synthase [Brachymonas sp.]
MTTQSNQSVPARIPEHVAIVMDGNGRWAKQRYMPRLFGHRQGIASLKRCVKACVNRNIKALTVFAFSSENWNRPAEEVSGLMDLLVKLMRSELPELHEQGVRVCIVGEREGLSDAVRASATEAENVTSNNTRMVLNVCINYGGRWDIAQAAARLAAENLAITPDSLQGAMALSHVPDPDLLIRTGGEQRISNFLLWQCAYSELYFTETLWPDFDEAALDAALADYAGRERRFGKTSAQVQVDNPAC